MVLSKLGISQICKSSWTTLICILLDKQLTVRGLPQPVTMNEVLSEACDAVKDVLSLGAV